MAYRRNRFYDGTTGQFNQQDPIGLAGGANAYGFSKGDPVNYSDPFGLCPGSDLSKAKLECEIAMANYGAAHPKVAIAAAGVLVVASGGLLAAGLAEGTAAVATSTATTTTMTVTRFAPAGVAVSGGTEKLINMLQEAGPSMNARMGAVSAWLNTLPGRQKALQTILEGGSQMLSGGAGARARQIIMQADGTTIVKALNVGKNMFEVIARISPK